MKYSYINILESSTKYISYEKGNIKKKIKVSLFEKTGNKK